MSLQRSDSALPPSPGQVFRHVDGGFYRVLMMARHSDDGSPLVVYEHLWPFETGGEPWARPLSEWAVRFRSGVEAELELARRDDRAAAQAVVSAAKAARRALTEQAIRS